MTQTPARRLAYAAWLTVCLVWGTTYLGIRIALESIPPALIGGIRYTIAGAALLVWLRVRGERLPPVRVWPSLALVGVLLIVAGNGFVIWAELWVPSGIAAVMIAAAPFWMSSMEALTPHGERLRATTIVGLCVGFAGIILLVWPDLRAPRNGGHFLFGVILLQMACAGWSAGSVYAKRYVPPQNVLAASAVEMIVGGVVMLAVATAIGEWKALTFTPRTIVAEVYLTIVGSLVAYSAYVYALEQLPVSTVSLYAYANPVIAVMLGSLVLGEPFGPRVIAASALVLAGIAIVRWRSRRVRRLGDR